MPINWIVIGRCVEGLMALFGVWCLFLGIGCLIADHYRQTHGWR